MGRVLVEFLKRLALTALLSIVTIGGAQAASVPTPAPGSGTVVAAPAANNPTQYNFTPNTVISSQAVNSVHYKIYGDLNNLITFLSSCSYFTGFDILGIVNGTGITATTTGCNAVTGQSIVIGLSHGDYITASPSSAQNVNINITGTVAAGGETSTYFQVPTTGYVSRGGVTTYPFDAVANSTNNHFEHFTLAVAANASTAHAFAIPYSTATSYQCAVASSTGNGQYEVSKAAASISIFAVTAAQSIDVICLGS